MTTERIDVLAGLDAHASGMRASSACGGIKLSKAACGNVAKELTDIRAAVAELIEACHEFNETQGKVNAAAVLYGEESNQKPMREARGEAIRAVRRYRAALARVGGA